MEQSKIKIGLEIHGYLTTQEKLFCRCPTNYKTAEINTNICPVCTAQPGSKPMLPNHEALKKVIAISLMLGCKISDLPLIWQRKHYDWPDLPKGFQDTTSGAYAVPVGTDGEFLGISIHHVHIEEDPARWDPETGDIDYNRCGMPLVEIVTNPEFKDSKQAREWLNHLVLTLSYIKALDKDAGIKADVNVSVNFEGRQGDRVEVKNLNSIASIEKAIDYEIMRQIEVLKKGEKIKRETRTFSDIQKVTIAMRAKEETEEYRYIPDPDLPLVEINKKEVAEIEKTIPESPKAKINRFVSKYGIDEKAARVLASSMELADFFEKIAKKTSPKLAAYWTTIELLRILNWNKKELNEVKIEPEHFIELLELLENKKITEEVAKHTLNKFIPKSFSPKSKLKNAERITDKNELEVVCLQVFKNNEKAVQDYKGGEEKALHFLIGQAMAATKGRADIKTVREIILKKLH